jgi:hypothetical protein
VSSKSQFSSGFVKTTTEAGVRNCRPSQSPGEVEMPVYQHFSIGGGPWLADAGAMVVPIVPTAADIPVTISASTAREMERHHDSVTRGRLAKLLGRVGVAMSILLANSRHGRASKLTVSCGFSDRSAGSY